MYDANYKELVRIADENDISIGINIVLKNKEGLFVTNLAVKSDADSVRSQTREQLKMFATVLGRFPHAFSSV